MKLKKNQVLLAEKRLLEFNSFANIFKLKPHIKPKQRDYANKIHKYEISRSID